MPGRHCEFETLFTRTWWQYNAGAGWPEQVYHWFNLAEGVAWLVVAALVLRRYLRFRNSLWELIFTFAFITFGLSDFREAYHLQSGLILFKAINLLVLIALAGADYTALGSVAAVLPGGEGFLIARVNIDGFFVGQI